MCPSFFEPEDTRVAHLELAPSSGPIADGGGVCWPRIHEGVALTMASVATLATMGPRPHDRARRGRRGRRASVRRVAATAHRGRDQQEPEGLPGDDRSGRLP